MTTEEEEDNPFLNYQNQRELSPDKSKGHKSTLKKKLTQKIQNKIEVTVVRAQTKIEQKKTRKETDNNIQKILEAEQQRESNPYD